jgi:hypothetical protein
VVDDRRLPLLVFLVKVNISLFSHVKSGTQLVRRSLMTKHCCCERQESLLARFVRAMESVAFRSCCGSVSKRDLQQLEKNIMSAISDFSAIVTTAFQQMGQGIQSISGSVAGLTEDINGLKALIEQLQNNPGSITPEDQALLDQAQVAANTLAADLNIIKDALALLDAQTQNPPTP